MATPESHPEDPWAAATYRGNERDQLLRWSKMTFTEKVRWLEKAHLLSIKLDKARREKAARQQTSGPQ